MRCGSEFAFTFSVGGGILVQAANKTATDDIRSKVALARCEDFGVGEKFDRVRFIAILSGIVVNYRVRWPA